METIQQAQVDENNNSGTPEHLLQPNGIDVNTEVISMLAEFYHKMVNNTQGHLVIKILDILASLVPTKIPKPVIFALYKHEGISSTVKALQELVKFQIIEDRGFFYSIKEAIQVEVMKYHHAAENKFDINIKIFENFKTFLFSLKKSDDLYTDAMENAVHFSLKLLSAVASKDVLIAIESNLELHIVKLANLVAWETQKCMSEKSAQLFRYLLIYYDHKEKTSLTNTVKGKGQGLVQGQSKSESANFKIKVDKWLCQNNLAHVLRLIGNHKEAKEILLDILESEEKILGPRHPITITTVHELLEIEKEAKSTQVDLKMTTNSEGQEKVKGQRSTNDTLSRLHYDREIYKKAARTVNRIMPSRLEILGPYHQHKGPLPHPNPKPSNDGNGRLHRSQSMSRIPNSANMMGLGIGVFPSYFRAIRKDENDKVIDENQRLVLNGSSRALPRMSNEPFSRSNSLRRSFSFSSTNCAKHGCAFKNNLNDKNVLPKKSTEINAKESNDKKIPIQKYVAKSLPFKANSIAE